MNDSLDRNRLRNRVTTVAFITMLVALTPPPAQAAETADWTVENRSPASEPARFAAAELQRYLTETTKHRESKELENAKIVIGRRTDLGEKEVALLPEPKTGYDGYAVAITKTSDGKPLWIIGGDNDRGTVYGAYDVLERVGWRWFHPKLDSKDPEVRPESTEATLEESRWAVASPMRTRALIWYLSRKRLASNPPSPARLAAQIDWAVKNRYNALEYRALEAEPDHPLRKALAAETKKRGMRLQAPGHNFDLFLPPPPGGFAAHPEWLGLRDGKRRPHSPTGAQFCWTNEEAIDHFIHHATAFVKDRPELDTLTLSAIDGGGAKPCECETCSEQSPTDRYLGLINQLTAHLEEEAPEVTVEAIVGYQHVKDVPETVRPHERLRGRFAVWQRGLERGYGEDPHGPLLRKWSDVFDQRLTAFQYYSDHLATSPLAAPWVIQMKSDRAFIEETGADGMLNLVYLEGYWWRQTLNGSLAGRAFYDPSTDPDEMLADYARRYHGPAAGPHMADYYAALAQNPSSMVRVWQRPTKNDLRDVKALRSQSLDVAKEALTEDPVFRYRLEKAEQWQTAVDRVIASTAWLGIARRLATLGRDDYELYLKRAEKRHEIAQADLEDLANLQNGVIDRGIAHAYRARYETEVGAVQRKAAKGKAAEKN